jgi:hypothetical protein
MLKFMCSEEEGLAMVAMAGEVGGAGLRDPDGMQVLEKKP